MLAQHVPLVLPLAFQEYASLNYDQDNDWDHAVVDWFAFWGLFLELFYNHRERDLSEMDWEQDICILLLWEQDHHLRFCQNLHEKESEKQQPRDAVSVSRSLNSAFR